MCVYIKQSLHYTFVFLLDLVCYSEVANREITQKITSRIFPFLGSVLFSSSPPCLKTITVL